MSVVAPNVNGMDHDVQSPGHTVKPPYSWTVAETNQLVARYEAGASVEQLSTWSKRSPHHVVVHLAWVLWGVGREDVNPLAPRFREPWSDDEIEQLFAFVAAEIPLGDVAAVLGRDVTDVAWQLVLQRQCVRGISRAG